MSVQTPEVYSYKDTQSVFPYGEAMMTDGLTVRDAVDGFGLMTDGFIWEAQAIWICVEEAMSLSTTWSAIAGASTLSTTWTASTVFGEAP